MLGCKEFYDKTAAMGEDFTLVREMPSDMKIWAHYLFQKLEEVRS